MVDADPSRAGISILGLDIGGTKIASAVVTFLAGQISCDDWVHTNKVVSRLRRCELRSGMHNRLVG